MKKDAFWDVISRQMLMKNSGNLSFKGGWVILTLYLAEPGTSDLSPLSFFSWSCGARFLALREKRSDNPKSAPKTA